MKETVVVRGDPERRSPGERQQLTVTSSSLFAEFSLETEKISFRASSFVVGQIFGDIW